MTNAHLHSLADKINGLDLTPEEQEALVELITGHGEEVEVDAFSVGTRPIIVGLEIEQTANFAERRHEFREHVGFCYQRIG